VTLVAECIATEEIYTRIVIRRLPAEQLHKIPSSLVWRQERNNDLPRAAALTAQSIFHLCPTVVGSNRGVDSILTCNDTACDWRTVIRSPDRDRKVY
jgi:hypothetical protein